MINVLFINRISYSLLYSSYHWIIKVHKRKKYPGPTMFQCIYSLFLAAGSVWQRHKLQQALDLFAAGFWSFQSPHMFNDLFLADSGSSAHTYSCNPSLFEGWELLSPFGKWEIEAVLNVLCKVVGEMGKISQRESTLLRLFCILNRV